MVAHTCNPSSGEAEGGGSELKARLCYMARLCTHTHTQREREREEIHCGVVSGGVAQQ
jgi:hypothetical protein